MLHCFLLYSISINSDNTDSMNSDALYTRGLDNPTPHMKLILNKEKRKEKSAIWNDNYTAATMKMLRNKK